MLTITKHADKLFEVHKRYRKCRSKTAKKKCGRTILSSKCAICGSKKSRFMKE